MNNKKTKLELIKKVRQNLNLSQEDLARELGVSFATINRWENGQSSPSKIAWRLFKNYCNDMRADGKLKYIAFDDKI